MNLTYKVLKRNTMLKDAFQSAVYDLWKSSSR